jgi:hypothetical protein
LVVKKLKLSMLAPAFWKAKHMKKQTKKSSNHNLQKVIEFGECDWRNIPYALAVDSKGRWFLGSSFDEKRGTLKDKKPVSLVGALEWFATYAKLSGSFWGDASELIAAAAKEIVRLRAA